MRVLVLTVLFSFIGGALSWAQGGEEVGTIDWGRNYDEALERSAASGKPIFLLFQEVPGCRGCRDFGAIVLSNPLFKKAVEEAFIPVMIKNNVGGGHDAEILKRFVEPAWNYQVIRFIGGSGKELIPRKDKVWDIVSLAKRMHGALKAAGRKIPRSLDLVLLENEQEEHRQVTYSMFCYWTGEAELGKVEGVVTTEAGWIGNKEVTLVTYHQKRISLSELTSLALEKDCAKGVYVNSDLGEVKRLSNVTYGVLDHSYRRAKDSDQKKQLQGSGIINHGYTKAQLTKINAWIRSDQALAADYL